MRDIILHQLIQELENVDYENNCICFKTININTEKNKLIIEKHYPVLRKLYKLSAPTRKPKKFTSQTILQICKYQNYQINRKTKYRRDKDLNRDTTFGFYNIVFDNDPLV